MKPIFSEEERVRAVRNLIVARYQKHVTIISYSDVVTYLNEGRLEALCTLKKSGRRLIGGHMATYEEIYNESDAETYFEWLIATVSGTRADATEELIKKTNDQLFQIIDILGDNLRIVGGVRLLRPYEGQDMLNTINEKLTITQSMLNKHDEEIAEFLNNILMWLKKYGPILDTMEKEYVKLFGVKQKK